MKSKIYLIIVLIFISYCITNQPKESSIFAEYTNKCSSKLVRDEKECYLEKYITPEGVRIAIREENNEPFSNSIQVWKESILSYLEESGYEILEKTSKKEYEFVKTRAQIKENHYIYGLAFSIKPTDPKKIYLIEFFGEENTYKKYEKEIIQIIDHFYKKK